MMTPKELLVELARKGGAIVSSSEASEIEIADSQVTKRFAIDNDGLGFIRRTKEWLNLHMLPTDDEVREYINTLPWTDDATDHEKTLVGGNIIGFVSWLRNGKKYVGED